MNTSIDTGDYEKRLVNYAVEFMRRILQENPLSWESQQFLQQFWQMLRLHQEHVTAVEAQIFQYRHCLNQFLQDDEQRQLMVQAIVQSSLQSGEPETVRDGKSTVDWRRWRQVTLIGGGLCMTTVLIGMIAWSYLARPVGDRPPATTSQDSNQPSSKVSSVQQPSEPDKIQTPESEQPEPGQLENQAEKEARQWRDRLTKSGIGQQFFQNLLNDQDAIASLSAPDANSSQPPYAQTLYNRLEQLTPETRSRLGTYTSQDYNQWLQELGERGGNPPRRTVIDNLTDERFFQLFPELRGRKLNPQTFGQIWFAIAEEQLPVARAQQPYARPNYPNYEKPFPRQSPYRPGRKVPMSSFLVHSGQATPTASAR